MRRKKQEQDAPACADRRVSPADVQQVEFRLAFRGYSERDVDAFLDKITEDLSSYLEENEHLRSGAGLPAASAAVGSGEAEEIVSRARAEAATIVRRAEEDAAAIRTAAGTGAAAAPIAGDARAAIAPFLNTEREFLQGLGALVQGHAEEIKQMVLALRARAETAVPATASAATPAPARRTDAAAEAPSDRPPDASSVPVVATAARQEGQSQDERPPFARQEEGPDPFAPASASEIADRLGMSDPAKAVQDDERVDEVGTVVIESSTEPAYSSEGSPAGERSERSLRELFWGED